MLGFRKHSTRPPQDGVHPGAADQCKDLYLALLKRSLLGLTYEDDSNLYPVSMGEAPGRVSHDAQLRVEGADWPVKAPTMIGVERLENIQRCIESVLVDAVPGDLIETGVWRGGAVIFMRGVLKAYGVTDRTVGGAHSFEGFPSPHPAKTPHHADLHLDHYLS